MHEIINICHEALLQVCPAWHFYLLQLHQVSGDRSTSINWEWDLSAFLGDESASDDCIDFDEHAQYLLIFDKIMIAIHVVSLQLILIGVIS